MVKVDSKFLDSQCVIQSNWKKTHWQLVVTNVSTVLFEQNTLKLRASIYLMISQQISLPIMESMIFVFMGRVNVIQFLCYEGQYFLKMLILNMNECFHSDRKISSRCFFWLNLSASGSGRVWTWKPGWLWVRGSDSGWVQTEYRELLLMFASVNSPPCESHKQWLGCMTWDASFEMAVSELLLICISFSRLRIKMEVEIRFSAVVSAICLISMSHCFPSTLKKWMKTVFGCAVSCSAHGTFLGWIRLEPHKPQQVPLDSTVSFGASTRVHILRKKNPDPRQSRTRGAEGRGGWRTERPAGIAWRGDGDRRAQIQSLFAAVGSQQGVKKSGFKEESVFFLQNSWMRAAPNLKCICERKAAFLEIWQSWRLTAVGTLIIHSLCWFSF